MKIKQRIFLSFSLRTAEAADKYEDEEQRAREKNTQTHDRRSIFGKTEEKRMRER